MTDYLPPEETTTNAKAVPHSRESEEATVGAVFINPEVFYECASVLQTNDFYIHRHKWIWEAFVSLVEQHQPIDLLTVSNELDRRGQLAEIGGPAYLTSLVNQVPSSLNAESYARVVKGLSTRRNMINAANQIATLAYSEHIPLDEAINDVWEVIENALDNVSQNETRRINEIMSEAYDRMDEMSQLEDEDKPVIRTGLLDMDIHLRIRKKQLITFAARPGIGKSALALTIAKHTYRSQRKSIALFTLEMGDDEVGDRLIAQDSDINLTHILDAKLETNEWAPYVHAVETLSDGNLFINDNGDITAPQIRAECKKLKARYGLDLVIVDYGGLVDAPGNNPNERSSYVSRNLKKLAKALNVPVLMLWQMNRSIEGRADGEPVLSDLRDSGSIEQDSDTVVFLYVKDEPNPKSKINHVKCSIAKQRNGPTAKFDLARHTVTTRFDNAIAIYS